MTTPPVLARPALAEPPAAPSPELTFSTQDASRLTGVPPHTLRWYERMGLVPDVGRGPTGRRRFTRRNLDWIMILRALRSTGMPVATLQDLTGYHQAGDADRLVRLVRTQRAQVLVLMSRLHRSLDVLDAVEAHLDGAPDPVSLVPTG